MRMAAWKDAPRRALTMQAIVGGKGAILNKNNGVSIKYIKGGSHQLFEKREWARKGRDQCNKKSSARGGATVRPKKRNSA